MGKMVAPEGCSSRLRSSVRPTLAGFSVAPITATVRGWKIGASGLGGQKGGALSRTGFSAVFSVITETPLTRLLLAGRSAPLLHRKHRLTGQKEEGCENLHILQNRASFLLQ